MKKTLLCAASLVAAGSFAQSQPEVMSVASDEVQAIIQACIEAPVTRSNPAFFIVDPQTKVYPEGTFASGADAVVAADGKPIDLTSYEWSYCSGMMSMTAVSTPNADATSKDAWPKKGNGNVAEDGSWTGNEALNVAGCEPQFLYGVCPKNGNPTGSYRDFYDANSDGSSAHRVYDGPYWEPGCGWVPQKGCFYEFNAQVGGELKVALWVNKNLANNPVYILKGSELVPSGDIAVVGFMQNNTFEKDENGDPCGTLPYVLNADYKLVPASDPSANPGNRPFYGYFTFKVEANTTYMVFSPKSQLGFFGYQYIADEQAPTAISQVEAQGAPSVIYSLSGQRVNAMQQGIYVVNGKKVSVR